MSAREAHKASKLFVDQVCAAISKEKRSFDHAILSEEGLSRWPTVKDDYGWRPVGHQAKVTSCRERPMPSLQFIHDYLEPAWRSYGNIKIFVTLRNQVGYLASLYAQAPVIRRKASQSDFERQVDALLSKDDPSINWEALVEDVERLFGSGRCFVLLFEEMGP